MPGQSMKRIEALRLAGVTVKADIDAPLEVAARETIPTLTWVHCGRLSLATDDAYEWAMEHEEEINVWRAVLHDLWCADWIKAPKEVAVPDKPILVTTLPDGAVVQGAEETLAYKDTLAEPWKVSLRVAMLDYATPSEVTGALWKETSEYRSTSVFRGQLTSKDALRRKDTDWSRVRFAFKNGLSTRWYDAKEAPKWILELAS